MAFIDFLAFQEAMLLVAAVLVGYVSVAAMLAMRRNDTAGLKGALKGGAVPIGFLGVIATTLSVWGEIAWPLPGAYNIFFTDVFLLFGLTLVVLAVSMATSSRLQYAGVFAFVAGGITLAYGWSGYQLHMTKDPLETFLLYGAFGLTGILAFPATLIADHYLLHPTSASFAVPAGSAAARRRPSLLGATRAVQPIVPSSNGANAEESTDAPVRFRVPIYMNATLLVFVVMVALAGIAALLYLDSTLPAHLASPP